MPPSERWPALLLQLDPDDWTRAQDLARALGVSERTVYRDVHALVEAGVPLQGVPGKGYRLPDDYLLSPLRLTTDEAVMLVLGSAYAARNVDGRHRAAAETARRKIERRLPESDRERALALQGSVHLVPPSIFGDAPHEGRLKQLRHALVEERTLVASLSDGSNYTVDPYGLVRQGSAWHLVGRAHERDRVVHLHLGDIESVRTTNDTFHRPASYGASTDGPPAATRTRVRVVFESDVADSVDVAPSVDVEHRERLSDGRLLLALAPDDELEVMPWLLSWGTHVRILEPRALRERVAAEAQAVADQYDAVPTLLD